MFKKATTALAATVLALSGTLGLTAPATATATATATVTTVTAQSAGAKAFGNGGFEAPSLQEGKRGLRTFKAGQRLDRWEVTYGDVDLSNRWPAAEGRNSLDLNGCHGGSVAQTFTTKPGIDYTLSFRLAGNPEGDFGIKQLVVQAAGDSDSFEFDSRVYRGHRVKTVRGMAWKEIAMALEAEKDTSTVEFVSASGSKGCNGPVIDDVRVSPRT